MEYIFKNKKYLKLVEVKKTLTRIKNNDGYEIAFDELKLFLRNNEFPKTQSFGMLDIYIDYALKLKLAKEKIFHQIFGMIKQIDLNQENFFLKACKLIKKVDVNFCVDFVLGNLKELNSTHEVKINTYLFLADLYIEKKDYDNAFKICIISKELFDEFDLFNTLRMKSLVYERMSVIGLIEDKSHDYFFNILNYLILDISSDILGFQSIHRTERHLMMFKENKHYILQNNTFQLQFDVIFKCMDDFIDFMVWFIEERILKMLISQEYEEFWKIENITKFDFNKAINSHKNNPIIELPKYFKKLKVYTVSSNINALFGHALNKYISNEEYKFNIQNFGVLNA